MWIASIAVPAGTNNAIVTLVFPAVPAGFTGHTYARFRLSSDPAAADAPEPPDPADVLSLLGTDIGGRSRGIALQDVLDRPREEADSPPRSPRGDVDLSSIRDDVRLPENAKGAS